MKFLERLRTAAKGGDAEVAAQEPRLLGYDKPYYSVGARDAFLDVLVRGSAASRPTLTLSQPDAVRELDRAVLKASAYCNKELEALMLAFRDAAIELSTGGCSEEAVRAARDHFALGCRLALGTND